MRLLSRLLCFLRTRGSRSASPRNPGPVAGEPFDASELGLGIAFWTVLTLIASALPVKLPRGTHQAVALAPLVAAMALGGPAVGGWVAAIGTTEMRELRGRIPWYGTLVNHAGVVLPIVVAGVVRVAIVGLVAAIGIDEPDRRLLRDDRRLPTVFCSSSTPPSLAGVVALRTGQSFSAVIVGDYRDTAFNNLALAPLGLADGGRLQHPMVGDAPVRAAAVHDPHGLAAVRRDARHVHPDDRRLGRGRGQARSVYRAAQPAGQGDRGRHRAGDAGQRCRARGPGVGRPAPRRRQDRRAGRRCSRRRTADPRGADDHECAPGPGRADHRAGHQARAGAADHSPSPRVVQRLGLPGPADRRRDPEARADPPRRRRVRGDDGRPPVPHDAADRTSRRSPSCASSPASSSTRSSSMPSSRRIGSRASRTPAARPSRGRSR